MQNILKKIFGFIVFDIVETVVIALAVFVIIYIFIASPHIIVGHSMDTSFSDGEFLLINELSYRFGEPQRGDVIVFKFDATHDYIKRILGLPGDKVEVMNGSLFLNGKQVDESAYVTKDNYTSGLDFLADDKTITVPADKYFVLGDNRRESSDSRQWGFVDKSAIKGKAWVVYWPLQKAEFVPSETYTTQGNVIVASTK